MIKNVIFKKVLKNSVFKVASRINKFIPKDDKIVLLYSANKGIQFSLIPLRDFLLENNFDKRYRIVCGIENMRFSDDCGLEFVPRLRAYILFFRAKHVFYTAGQIPIKPSKSQCVIHLRHGNTNFKCMGKLTGIGNGDEFFFTYMAASAPLFKPIMAKEYGCTQDNIAVIGDPVIDSLFKQVTDKSLFSQYSKMILWLPTFRQSDYLGYYDSANEDLVPLINENDYAQLNELLGYYNIKLIVKIHPSQKNVGTANRHLTNLDIYTHEEFLKTEFSLETLMAQSDALIGDYSSASMQYLVFDKPLGFVVPDIDEYSKKRGFIFENPEDYMGGHIIKSKVEFKQFIDDMANNSDPFAEKRRTICKAVYQYVDNHNCERVIKLSGMR